MTVPIVYIVQPGDTLYTLGKRFDTTAEKIAQLNGLSEPDRIFPGQRLVVTGDAPAVRTYTVQRGDTLYTIAKRFGTTVAELTERNGLKNPDLIYPGQVLRLP